MNTYTFWFNDYSVQFQSRYEIKHSILETEYSKLIAEDRRIIEILCRFFNRIPSPDTIIGLYHSDSILPYISLEQY